MNFLKRIIKRSTLFHLLRTCKYINNKYKFQFFFLSLLLILLGVFEVSALLVISPLIAILSGTQNPISIDFILPKLINSSNFSQTISNLTYLLLFFTFITLILRISSIWLSTRFVANVGNDLSSKCYKSFLCQEYSTHVNRNTSSVISLVTLDCERTANAVGAFIRLLTGIIVTLSIFIGLIYSNFAITISITFCLCAFFLTSNILLKKPLIRIGNFITDQNDSQLRIVAEGSGAIRDILLSNQQPYFSNIFKTVNINLRRASALSVFFETIPRYLLESFGIMTLVLIIISLNKPDNSFIELQSFLPYLATFVYGSQKLLPSTNSIYSSINEVRSNKGSIEKVFAQLKTENNYKFIFKSTENVFEFKDSITFKNVSFCYPNSDLNTLEAVDLVIRSGDNIGIVGETGAGKSTFLDLIMGLLSPTSGKILVDGVDINKDRKNIQMWRELISHVPQMIFLSDASIASNIALGLDELKLDKNLIISAAEISCLKPYLNSIPYGIDTIIGEKGLRISGGQRQRIGISRALYRTSKLLVLDEATSALDGMTEKKIMESIYKMKNRPTLIKVAHRLTSLSDCNKIFEVKDKKVTYLGNPTEAFKHS